MAVNINVKLNADDSSVKKKLSELGKLAKKGLNFGGGKDGTPSSSGKPSRASTILEKAMNDLAKAYKKEKQNMEKQGKARYAWEKTKFAAGKVGRFAGAAAEGVHTGASLLTRATSGKEEYASGGFMNSVHDKISAGQETYAKAKEGYTSIKDAYKGQAEVKDEQGNVTQKARKGGVAAAALAGIPVIGGLLGAIVGGVMKQVDDMGKEWTSVMASQSGTTAATGGYVGGGGGLFQNSQMAQAKIALRRTQGQLGYGEGLNVGGNMSKFAAQQNIGIAQYAEQLGQLKENDKSVSTDFLRGAADINKMTGLKQGQFVAKLASYSNSLKEAGFSQKSIKQFASVTAGLAKTGMTGERAMTVGQNIDQDMRKGIGGGALSKMAVSGLMDQGYSLHEARKIISKGGITDERVRNALNPTLQGLDEETRTHMMEKEGWGNYGELSSVSKITAPKISRSKEALDPFINLSMKQTSDRQSAVAQSVAAAKSAQIGYEAGDAQLKAFEKLSPAFEPIIKLMEKAETELFEGVDALTTEIKSMMTFMQKAQKEGIAQTLGEEIGKNIKLPWSR